MATSIGVTSRLIRGPKKHETMSTTSSVLVNKLRQDGQMNTGGFMYANAKINEAKTNNIAIRATNNEINTKKINIVESVMHAVENLSELLTTSFNNDLIRDNILNVCQHLKVYGAYLEVLYKEQMERAFVVFRNSCQDEETLDYTSRLHLLELIELRANMWKPTEVMHSYYKKKNFVEIDASGLPLSESSSTATIESNTYTAPVLAPGEIMKSSGKFAKPTRIPGKNYCKDEVVIRNADSGKVMGIKGRRVHMIEELSETIISFQRVNPGAKERLVQITGPNETTINHAKQLMEDTIRRNASPIRDPNAGVGVLAGSSSSIGSSGSEENHTLTVTNLNTASNRGTLVHSLSTGDASVGEYKFTVVVNGETLKITGTNFELVRMSKIILDDVFINQKYENGDFYNIDTLLNRTSTSQFETNVANDEAESTATLTNAAATATTTASSLLTPTSPTSTTLFNAILSNGQIDDKTDDYEPLRRPKSLSKAASDTSGVSGSSQRLVYSMTVLGRLSMSPLCVIPPPDWSRILEEHPTIARKVPEVFNAEQYLSNRSTMQHVLCTSASDESILSGSSV